MTNDTLGNPQLFSYFTLSHASLKKTWFHAKTHISYGPKTEELLCTMIEYETTTKLNKA